MITKRRLVIIALIAFTAFVAVTNYLLATITATESEVRSPPEVPDLIYRELKSLPPHYKTGNSATNGAVNAFISNINKKGAVANLSRLWKIANSWVSKTGLVDLESPLLGQVYATLKKSRIVKADVDARGTQLKLLLTLEGNQDVVFKPKWYDKDRIIEGPVYGGRDRYGSEIVGFYLSAVLDKPFTPFSVERTVSLTHEVAAVATKQLLEVSFKRDNRTCVYGKCFYCKPEYPICDDDDYLLPGAVIFNVNASLKSYRSPWQRTYKSGKKAPWEESDDYCKLVRSRLSKQRLLDLIDTAIFDFLIQNGDRHHYETLYDNVVLLDNGKGFGNPNVHHIDILAPLYQCCTLRKSTLRKLTSLSGGKLRRYLEAMPDIDNLVTKAHLKAVEERLLIVFSTVEYCRNRNKALRN